MNLKKGGMLWLNYTKDSLTLRSRSCYPVISKEKSNGLTFKKCWASNRDGSGSWSNVTNKIPPLSPFTTLVEIPPEPSLLPLKRIFKELSIEKKLIGDKQIPLHSYNYSYIKDRLETVYDQKVSVPTIIDRAKKKGFYLKKPQRRAHDREVLTQYIGQLIHELIPPTTSGLQRLNKSGI